MKQIFNFPQPHSANCLSIRLIETKVTASTMLIKQAKISNKESIMNHESFVIPLHTIIINKEDNV